jgi:hypothetical protein
VVCCLAVNGEFFNMVVEKIAEERNHTGQNRDARSEPDAIPLCVKATPLLPPSKHFRCEMLGAANRLAITTKCSQKRRASEFTARKEKGLARKSLQVLFVQLISEIGLEPIPP